MIKKLKQKIDFEKRHAGFTLIEMIIVISIIALLATSLLIGAKRYRMSSRDAQRISDLTRIKGAIELYYSVNHTFPPSPCGVDCPGTALSSNSSDWSTLESYLKPYLGALPVDPVNTSNCAGPWVNGCYVYSYGNAYVTPPSAGQMPSYDLTGQLETSSHPLACVNKHYTHFYDNRAWCGTFSSQIYEASR